MAWKQYEGTKMTVSLLQSYDWLMECPPSWKDRAKEALVNNLNKIFNGGPALERGQAYEDMVNKLLMEGHPVPAQLERLRGLEQQKWMEPLEIGGCLFRGRLDYIDKKNGIIYDLKTTKSAVNHGNYRKKWQHIVYMLAEGIDKFEYVVAQFSDETGLEPWGFEIIPVALHETDKERLEVHIDTFVRWMKENDLYDTYINVYCQK